MQDKIKQYLTKEKLLDQSERFRDPRFTGLMLFLVIVLMISWSGVKAIETNYLLQKQISELQQQNAVKQLENNNQKLKNEYYNTDQYLELSARENFGLAAPGEKEILVPKSVALAHTVDLPKEDVSSAPTPKKQPFYKENYNAWLDFFLHRQSSTN